MKFLERALDGKNQWWKYLLVIFGSFILSQIILMIPLIILTVVNVIRNDGKMPEPQSGATSLSQFGLSQNGELILMLSVFVVLLISAIFLIKKLHNRSFSEIVNGRKKIRWNRFWVGVFIWGTISLIYIMYDYISNPTNFKLQFNLMSFIPLFFISFILIPWQTTCEEFMFRGYLAQGIGAWTRSRWLAIIIPALLFGLLHFANPEVKEFGFWVTMPQYIGFGLLFGLISVLDDGIELAMGMHAINNILASLVTTHKASAFQTSAIFEIQEINPQKDLSEFIIISVIVFVLLAKKYKWNLKILNQKIEKESDSEKINTFEQI